MLFGTTHIGNQTRICWKCLFIFHDWFLRCFHARCEISEAKQFTGLWILIHNKVWYMITFIGTLLTHSTVQSPSWAANWFAASQEIPRISRNPKVHYRTQKRPPPVSILDQPNPVHIPTSHLLEIRPNIIHPSTPRSSQWSPSLRFPHQDSIQPTSTHNFKMLLLTIHHYFI